MATFGGDAGASAGGLKSDEGADREAVARPSTSSMPGPPVKGDLLREGIARNAPAVLCLPSAGMLRHLSTRLIGEREDGFFVESPAGEQSLLDQLIADGSPVGVAFKAAQRKVVFTVPLCARQADFAINEQTRVEALLLRFPEELRPVQRRAHYRVTLPLDPGAERAVGMRMWRIAEHAVLRDRPMAAQEVPVAARNLSVGGTGFVCPHKAPAKDAKDPWREIGEGGKKAKELPRLAENERVRVMLAFGGEELLLEGRVRYTRRLSDGSLAGGLQFKKLEKDLEGRQTLSRLTAIVGDLQREEIRRRRGVQA